MIYQNGRPVEVEDIDYTKPIFMVPDETKAGEVHRPDWMGWEDCGYVDETEAEDV